VTGLSQVFLLVGDLARSIRFYRELLGRPPAAEDDRHARFALGSISLTVHADLTPPEASRWRVDPIPERRGWGVYLTLLTDDLERTHSSLEQIGAEVVAPIARTPWGSHMCIVKDPDGYLLELCQRP